MRSCIPQKHPPARTAFSLFWLIASLPPSSRLGQGVSGTPRSPRPAAGETLRRLRAFPGPRLSPAAHHPRTRGGGACRNGRRDRTTTQVEPPTWARRELPPAQGRPPGCRSNPGAPQDGPHGAGPDPVLVPEAARLCKLATPMSMHSREGQTTLPGRSCRSAGRVPVRYASRSTFAARMTRTFPQVTVSSGWWNSRSASSATLVANPKASRKSPKVNSRRSRRGRLAASHDPGGCPALVLRPRQAAGRPPGTRWDAPDAAALPRSSVAPPRLAQVARTVITFNEVGTILG